MGDGAEMQELAEAVNGCHDDGAGCKAKLKLVKAHVSSTGTDIIDVMFYLHLQKCVLIKTTALLGLIKWRKPSSQAAIELSDATHPGLYLSSALIACAPSDMGAFVGTYLEANPQSDVVDILRYVNRRGFVSIETDTLVSDDVTQWPKPDQGGKKWEQLWGEPLPSAGPTFVNVRDYRGRKAHIAFIGYPNEEGQWKSPSDILLEQWKLPKPSMCTVLDAGSMHPRKCDTENMMANLPQYKEWLARRLFIEHFPIAYISPSSQAPVPDCLCPPVTSAGWTKPWRTRMWYPRKKS